MATTIMNEKSATPLEIWNIKRERLSLISLPDVLETLGAIGNQDRDKNKWKIPGVGNIIIKRQQWFNGNLSIGGYGAVSLVRHALEFDKDTPAMNWLVEKFPDSLGGSWKKEIAQFKSQDEIQKESIFSPPDRVDDGLNDVKRYLIQERGLPQKLIEREIESGRIYATKQKFEHENNRVSYGESQCVFIGPSSAEIRSVKSDGFKGCCPGSDSDNSSYQVMYLHYSDETLSITEAAIDALSFHALNPHSYVVSTNGAGRFEQQYKLTLEAIRNNFATQWCFDADFAGDVATQRLFNALVLREKLSKEWDIPKDIIDEWIIQRKIVSIPSDSPHELFINQQIEEENFPVFLNKKIKFKENGENKIKIEKEDTGKTSFATVNYKVLKVCRHIKSGTSDSYELSKDEISGFLNKYKVSRMRPMGAKDWNEVWSREGQKAVDNYNDFFKKQQKQKVPCQNQVNDELKTKNEKQNNKVSKIKSRFARKIKSP